MISILGNRYCWNNEIKHLYPENNEKAVEAF